MLFEIRRLLKVATPVVEVPTEVVPVRFPGPDSLLASTVYSSDDVFAEIKVFEYLSCKVATGGGLKANAMNSSTTSLVGTWLKTTLLGTP